MDKIFIIKVSLKYCRRVTIINMLNFNRNYQVVRSLLNPGRTIAGTCAMLLFLVFTTSAYSQTKNMPDIAPEDSAWVYAYAGFGYYEWKMMSQNEYLSLFGVDDMSGIDFRHEAEPFVLKKYGVKANIFLLSLGLDYFSDRFSFKTDFDNTRDLQQENDRRSEQLKFLSGLRFGSWAFSATALFRDFNSVLTSRGYRAINDTVVPVYYYDEDGGESTLS